MTRFFIILFIATSAGFLSACSSAESQYQTAPTKVSLSDSVESHALVDDLALLGNIGGVVFLDDNGFIISDRKPSVSLFKDYKMVATFGSEGKGPCEFTGVSALDVSGDTLFVLNTNQSKIIKFDVNTQECLGEIKHKSILSNYYLHYRKKDHSFLLGQTSYIAPTPDSTSMMQILDAEGNAHHLGLTLGRIDAADSFVQFRSPGMNFSVSRRTLFTYFPLTDSLYALNLDNMKFRSFPVRINIKREDMESAGTDIDKVLKIIEGDEFQFVTQIVSSPSWVAIKAQQQASGTDEKQIAHLQFYTHDGKFIGEVLTQHKTVGYHNGKLIQIRQSTDPNAKHTYSMVFRDVILN